MPPTPTLSTGDLADAHAAATDLPADSPARRRRPTSRRAVAHDVAGANRGDRSRLLKPLTRI